MKQFFALLVCLWQLLALPGQVYSDQPDKTVLLAILARNKAHVLPRYLECIDNLDYDKSLISVYINTNNNVDETQMILEKWIAEHSSEYREIIYEPHDLKPFDSNEPHDWTDSERFKVLGKIRNTSLKMAQQLYCDYYFVVDCDNFIQPYTLSYLIEKDKPIIAPMLDPIPELNDPYSNYFCAISKNGYYQDHPDYMKIFNRKKVGTFKVPVVHCTYLIKTDYIDGLTYTDKTGDYEFIIFSRSARRNNVAQYLCNELPFGELIHFFDYPTLEEEISRMEEYFQDRPERCVY